MARRYSIAFKKEICERVRAGVPAAQVAREAGINVNTVYTWMSQFRAHPGEPFVGSGNRRTEDAGILAMEKYIRDLEEENEFLKKADAVFAGNLK